MSNPSKPVIRKPAQGRTVAVVGDVYRFLATPGGGEAGRVILSAPCLAGIAKEDS